MKKNRVGSCPNRHCLQKICRIMKLSALMLLFFGLTLTAETTDAQQRLRDLSLENATILEVFRAIENQSDFGFFFKDDQMDMQKRYSLNLEDASIEETLAQVFSDSEYSYKIIGDNVVVMRKEAASISKLTVSNLQQDGKTISGTVRDAKGEPIPGVSIVVKGSTTGTISNMDGNFTLSGVPEDAMLQFSFIGMNSVEVSATGRMTFNIVLQEEYLGLDEVVVVGYGVQKKANITGSVAVVDFEKMSESRPMVNISQGLAGEAPGVFVTMGSGKPNNDTGRILIRGQGTLNNSSPLVVIDGIVGSMGDVNPNDVASVSILKDAASASIYGSRAAGGVILITTKRGDSSKTKVSYNLYTGFETPSLDKDMMIWDYADHMGVINQAHGNMGSGLPFEQADIDDYRQQTDAGADPILYPNTNWFDYAISNAFVQEHNLSASGGSDKVRYLLSANIYENGGSMEDTDFNKYTFRANIDADVTNWLTVGANISGYMSKENGMDAEGSYDKLVKSPPGIFPVHPDGRIGAQQVDGEVDISSIAHSNAVSVSWQETQRTLGKAFAKISFNDKLKLNASYGIILGNTYSKNVSSSVDLWDFKKDVIVKPSNGNSSVKDEYGRYQNFVSDVFLTYNNAFNQVHNVGGLLGYNEEYSKNDGFDAKRNNLLSFDTDVLNAASGENPEVGGGYSDRSTRSVFGRINYNYKERYYFESNLRYDGSSKFTEGRRWGLFPSFSGGWRISQEPFMNWATGLDNLKIRASWGQLGNNRINDYGSQSLYKQVLYSFGGNIVQGAAPKENVNSLIQWETTTSTDIGFDAALLNYRLNIEAAYFNKKTEDILMQIPIPLVNGGFSDPYQNAGVVSNKGVELNIGWKDRWENSFSYGITGNFTWVKSSVDKFRGEVASYTGTTILQEGLSLYPYYVREVDGIATQEKIDQMVNDGYTFNPQIKPGDLLYKDQQKEGEEGYKEINDNDRVVKGSSLPEYLFGLNLNVGYKGFDFSTLLQGVAGIDNYYNNSWYTTNLTNGVLINKMALNAWTAEKPNTNIPRLTTSSNENTVANDFWLKDASYLRVKSIVLGYTLPSRITQKISIDRVRFFASGENLFTFTSFPGFDPELPSASYPIMKKVIFGLNVNF